MAAETDDNRPQAMTIGSLCGGEKLRRAEMAAGTEDDSNR